MRILIATPAPRRSRKGNRVTAQRWARLLRALEHRVTVAEGYHGQKCDLLLALHARKSAPSVDRFRRERPGSPIVLALTGTDLYRDLRGSASARRSLEQADRLVLLQPCALKELPASARQKGRVIYQSVSPPARPPDPLKTVFEVSVVGHLRDVKDPFRAAMAARELPESSKVRIVHVGAALTESMRERAERETERNPRYRWLGELPRWQTMRRLARSRLLVLTSKLEGGANVVGEAVAAGVPVVSSRIAGSVGLLGERYPGYFPVGDTAALRRLLLRCEGDLRFYHRLAEHCDRLRPLFDPAWERESWDRLIGELAS